MSNAASSEWVDVKSKKSLNRSQNRPWLTVPGDWRRENDTTVYPILWDDERGYGRLTPRPSMGDIEASYQLEAYYTHAWKEADGVAETGLFRWLVAWAWRFDRSVYISPQWLATYRPEKNLKVLDIGAGNGRLMAKMREAGHAVTGIEPDGDARRIALQNGLDIQPGTAERYPESLQTARFDVIFMIHVLEHCVEPELAVQNAVNLLNPGGLLIIETPNNESIGANMAGLCWRWLDVPRHLNFFTRPGLDKLISQSNLNLIQHEFRGYSRQFKREWVENEQHIWHLFSARFGDKVGRFPSVWRAAQLLLRSFWQRPEYKYDSVRVVACKK